jgi:dTDP-4-dehydrorhamnose 3,5-epimerase
MRFGVTLGVAWAKLSMFISKGPKMPDNQSIIPFPQFAQQENSDSLDLSAISGKFFIERLSLPEVILIRPKNVFRDRRGLFCETYRYGDFLKHTNNGLMMAQGSLSMSGPFVLRGMHYQLNNPQGKLLQICQGRIFDVAVDLRRSSPTFGKWCGAVLDASDPAAIYIPPRFGHGFLSFVEGATVFYLCTTYHDPASDKTIRWDDPAIGIGWPIGSGGSLTISAKDRGAPLLSDAEVFP